MFTTHDWIIFLAGMITVYLLRFMRIAAQEVVRKCRAVTEVKVNLTFSPDEREKELRRLKE